MPDFKKFRRAYVTSEAVPLVAVRQRGTLGINRMAYEALGEPKAVELLYAPDEQIIGLQAAERNAPDAYRIRREAEGRYEVAGVSFLKHYGIPLEKVGGRRYRAEVVDGILNVDLKQDPDT